MDLSGAFRFRSRRLSRDGTSCPPPEEILREAVYGLPELNSDELRSARLVANPGCYPTSVILGLRPLVKQAGSMRRAESFAIANQG